MNECSFSRMGVQSVVSVATDRAGLTVVNTCGRMGMDHHADPLLLRSERT